MVWWVFHVLSQFLFTTSKVEIDCYHQKVHVHPSCLTSYHNLRLRTLGNYESLGKSVKCLDPMTSIKLANQEDNFDISARNRNKSAIKKHSIENPVLPNFVNLFTIPFVQDCLRKHKFISNLAQTLRIYVLFSF